MADNNKLFPDNEKNGLKGVDSHKSFGNTQDPMIEAMGIRVGEALNAGKEKKKKRLPIVLDAVVGVLLLAMIVGVVVGAYQLFRFYTDDYEGVEVEYTFVSASPEIWDVNYRAMRNKGVYLDTGDNTVYFGQVVSSNVVADPDDPSVGVLTLVVKANVKYRADEGYTVEGHRIAVGSGYTLRSEQVTVSGAVVELENLLAKNEGEEGGR